VLFSTELNTTAAQNQYNRLKTDPNWVLQTNVSQVTITVLFYNGRISLFQHMTMSVEFLSSGRAWPTYDFTSAKLENYREDWDYVRLTVEVLFFAGLLYDVFLEGREMFRAFKSHGTLQAYFGSVWNYLEIGTILLMWSCLGLWAKIVDTSQGISLTSDLTTNSDTATLGSSMRSLLSDLTSLASLHESYLICACVTCVLLLIRSVKVLSFQPQMALLSNTLFEASSLLAHFMILFTVVFLGFGFVGYWGFGDRLVEFKTMWESILQCFSLLQGGLDWGSLIRVRPVLGPIYFITFTLTVTYLLMQMLLAIILEAFSEVKQNSDLSTSMFQEIGAGVRYFAHIVAHGRFGEVKYMPGHTRMIKFLDKKLEADPDLTKITITDLMTEFKLTEKQALDVTTRFRDMLQSYDEILSTARPNPQQEVHHTTPHATTHHTTPQRHTTPHATTPQRTTPHHTTVVHHGDNLIVLVRLAHVLANVLL